MEKVISPKKHSIANSTESALIQVSSIKDSFENGTLFINRDYQRNEGVWDKSSESKLILSVFENYPLGEIIRNRIYENIDGMNEVKYELVDGQQRITTIVKFMNDEITLTDEDSKKIIGDYLPYFTKSNHIKQVENVLKKFHSGDKISLKHKSLPQQLQEKIKTCLLTVRTLEVEDNDYILEYFRRVQSGKRLTNEDMVHTVINQLTNKTKEFSTNKKTLNLFDFVFENGEEKKDATRKINLCLLEMMALYCDGRDMGTPKDLWKWVDEQPNNEIKSIHMDALLLIKDFFTKINTENKKLCVGKTEIKLIFALVLFGYQKASEKIAFNIDEFGKFIFNIVLTSKDVKTFNTKRTPVAEDTLIQKLESVNLHTLYKENTEIFNSFSLLRAGSHGQDEVKTSVTKIINLFK